MSDHPGRVAYFTDAYLEIDGVANTARQFEAYARRHQVLFSSCTAAMSARRSSRMALLCGSSCRAAVSDLRWTASTNSTWLFRATFPARAEQIVGEFQPDVLHITGPSEVGILGAFVAHRLKIPLVASWHTNVHQYAERRALPLLSFLPRKWRQNLACRIGDWSFLATSASTRSPAC